MLSSLEIFFTTILSTFFIIVGYQFYFLPQRNPRKKPRVGNEIVLDSYIHFRPGWVWMYSGVYYPFILSTILTISSLHQFFSICSGYVLLLVCHVGIAYFYPIRTPAVWREYEEVSLSTWFLKRIQYIDKGGNCFPSMHVAVATLTAINITSNLHATMESLTPLILIFIAWIVTILVSASALFTKQHLVTDILPGAGLAVLVFVCHDHLIRVIYSSSVSQLGLFDVLSRSISISDVTLLLIGLLLMLPINVFPLSLGRIANTKNASSISGASRAPVLIRREP